MQFNDAGTPRRRVSLTPLIDVVFLLLVFFMLSSSFMQWRQVELQAGAESASATPEQDERWVTVSVESCGEGGVLLDGKPVALDAIQGRFAGYNLEKTHARVKVNDEAALVCMVEVLDALEAAQISSATVDGLIK